LLGVATPRQLSLLPTAEHRAIAVAFLRGRVLAAAAAPTSAAPFFFVGDRSGWPARQFDAARLQLFLFLQAALVSAEVCRQWLAALFSRPEDVGRQPQVRLLRRWLNGSGRLDGPRGFWQRRQFHGRPSTLDGRLTVRFLSFRLFTLDTDDRHFAADVARANIFFAAHGSGQRTGPAGRFYGDCSSRFRGSCSCGCRCRCGQRRFDDDGFLDGLVRFRSSRGSGRLGSDNHGHLAHPHRLRRPLRRRRRCFRRWLRLWAAAFEELVYLLDFLFRQAG
jgi:hypothetical protein